MHKSILKFSFAVALVFSCFQSFAQNDVKENKPGIISDFIKDSLDKYITREMQVWNIPGVAVSIVKNGKVVFMKGYGVRNIESKEPVDENTLFQIASNTKAYTGTSLALLQHQKRIKLDDLVTKYISNFELYDKYAGENATIRDLLCHRLGFQTFQGDILHWNCNMTRKELIRNWKYLKPVYPFRYKYGYCNMGFVTAGEIVSAVTDTTWDNFVKHNIFQKLNMNRTTTHYSDIVNDKNACSPYTIFRNKLTPLQYANIDNIGPCASINSCVKDISNWIIMQLDSGKFEGKEVIPFAVLRETRKSSFISGEPNNPQFPSKHFRTYGLGWELEDYGGKKIISHDGGADGFVTNTTLIPEEGFGFSILTNTDANWFFVALQQQLEDYCLKMPYKNHSGIYHKQYVAQTKEDNERISKLYIQAEKNNKPDFDISEYYGLYQNDFYGKLEIKNEGGKAILSLSHQPQVHASLTPIGGNNFICDYNHPTYGIHEIMFAQEGGKIKSVTIRVNDFVDYMSYDFIKE